MQKDVDAYFATEGKKTVCGLALALDMTPQTLINYANRDRFLDTVTRASQKIMGYYEELGQEARQGMFPDRMLTRMNLPCIERTESTVQVGSLADIAAQMAGQALPPGSRQALEGDQSPAKLPPIPIASRDVTPVETEP